MNTSSNDELADFRENLAPERFEVDAPSDSSFLPSTNASISKREDSSVEINWSEKTEAVSTAASEMFLVGMQDSAKRKVTRFPKSSQAHANLALALLKNGQRTEAMDELHISLDLDPKNYLAGLTLARLHFTEGRISEAQSRYEDLLKNYPKDAASLIGLSTLLMKMERFDEAHHYLLRAVETSKDVFLSRFLLGMVCLHRSDMRCALSEFRAASKLNFRNPNIHHAIGVAYALQGDHARAEKAFKTAHTLAPDSSMITIGLAQTLLVFQKHDQASEMLTSYLQLHPGDLIARDLLARSLMESKRYTAAKLQIRQIIRIAGTEITNDELSRHHCNLALAFMKENAFKPAEVELKRAIDIAPKASPIAYENLARVYGLSKRVPLGIRVLERAIDLFPASTELRLLLAALYAEDEYYRKAITQLEILRKQGKLPAAGYASLSSHYGDLQELAEALDASLEGYEKYPKAINITNNLAYFLIKDGQLSRAKEVLARRPTSEEPQVELTATLGLLRLCQGDYDAARRLYKQAESLATRTSQKDLARRVRQKMHLELARFHIKNRDFSLASREIRSGLLLNISKRSFKTDLAQLAASLEHEPQ